MVFKTCTQLSSQREDGNNIKGRQRIINDFRYYHQQHPSELSTVPKLVYHASKKITRFRSKFKYQRNYILQYLLYGMNLDCK